jgi:hypothetical protein
MSRKLGAILAGLCVLVPALAYAQTPEVKEKPAMYSYVSMWNYPRGQWGAVAKDRANDQKILDKVVASGGIVAYGNDVNLVHQPDGFSHDDWWSSTSLAGVLNVLDQFYKSNSTISPLLVSATKHSDLIFVSHHYNWKPGSYKDAYTRGASYKFKPEVQEEALGMLNKNLFEPLFEKLLAEGTIVEWEVDTEAVHTEAPGTFWVFYISPTAEGLDKTSAAVREVLKASPLSGPAFDSMVDWTAHRDYLARTNAIYK